MSWALRAHIRNLVLRASMGSSYQSSAELKKGSNAKCSVDLCPCPKFDGDEAPPPPTDDPEYVSDNIESSYQNFTYNFVVGADHAPVLKQCVRHAETKPLVCYLFWYCYMKHYGVRYAAKHDNEHGKATFKEVLTNVFLENDVDESGSVDANELSTLLARLDVDLPPEFCADLISVVDADGNGELDLEEFLDMMCIEVISDVFIDDLHNDLALLHERCSQLYCQVVSPFEIELLVRDVVQPSFCTVLVEAVYRCFQGCFSALKDLDKLHSMIEETIMLWFTGMRKPFHEVRRTSRFTRGAATRSAVAREEDEEGESTALVGDTERAELLDLRKQLTQLRHKTPAAPKKEKPSTARLRNVASLSLDANKHIGQRAPPIPTMNLAGCSEAFSETFKTPRPQQPLHTLREEHASWTFVEGRHSRYAARCAEWRSGPRRPSIPDQEPQQNSQRSTAKMARKYLMARVERVKESEIIAQREASKLRTAYSVAKQHDEECRHLDNMAGALDCWTPLQRKYQQLLSGPLFRYLKQQERRKLQGESLEMGKLITKYTRETRFRQMREAQLGLS